MITEYVTNDQLLRDILDTEKEEDAYYKIRTGFLMLANLSEKSSTVKDGFMNETYKYENLRAKCHKFLQELNAIRSVRNI